MEWGHPRFHDTGNKYIYSQSSQGENLVSAVFQEGVWKRKKKKESENKSAENNYISTLDWILFVV